MVIGLLNTFEKSIERAILNGYLLSGTISAIIGILAFLQLLPHSDTFLFLGRAKGLFQDPNVFGPFLIPVAVLSILRFEAALTVKKKLLWLFLFATLSSAVFLSFSRGAWINYLVSFIVFFFLWTVVSTNKSELIRRNIYLVIIFLLFLLGFVFILQSTNILEMFENRFGLQNYDNDRFASQLNVLNILIDKPFGVGPGQSDSISHLSPHSLYIRILGENGIMGFFIFITFLAITWFRSLYLSIFIKNPLYLLCTACLLGIFVNSLVIDTIHWRHFWLLLAIPWMSEKNEIEETR
jgi:O-antigen ligase